MIQMLMIEKYMNVLDKLYRYFILHCLYNGFKKENERKGEKRGKKRADNAVVLIRSCQGGIGYR